LSKIKVSARLKDDPSCVTNSSYTFTVINDFGDTYDLDCIGYTACVDGSIKAYTVWTVPKECRVDGAYVKYSYNKKLISKTYYVYFNYAEPDIQNNMLVYKFPCEIAAKEMSTDIAYEFHSANGDVLADGTFNLSDDYIKPLIDSGSYYSNTVKKLINYGAYTQIQLGFNTEKLANEYLPDEDKNLIDLNIVKENVSQYKATVTSDSSGITYYGSSLVTESTLKVKQYFIVDNSVQAQPKCYIDGEPVTPQYAGKNSKGSIYYIQSPGCSIMNMGVMNEYKIGGLTITYCPLSYIHTVVNSTSAETPLGDANRALYDFYSTLNYYAGE
ncbi:MAG: hypothetical protein KBS62_02425, partial [Oscillospiraceae bacterium]|nr:hypothetical protein [Candidatus Ruminococcus equi]